MDYISIAETITGGASKKNKRHSEIKLQDIETESDKKERDIQSFLEAFGGNEELEEIMEERYGEEYITEEQLDYEKPDGEETAAEKPLDYENSSGGDETTAEDLLCEDNSGEEVLIENIGEDEKYLDREENENLVVDIEDSEKIIEVIETDSKSGEDEGGDFAGINKLLKKYNHLLK